MDSRCAAGHRRIDERSAAFGKAIAERLMTHPEMIEQARSSLTRWMQTAAPQSRATLEEWQTLLQGPIETLARVLTEFDARSVRLRQSNPFAGLLPESERREIIRRFAQHDPRSA